MQPVTALLAVVAVLPDPARAAAPDACVTGQGISSSRVAVINTSNGRGLTHRSRVD